MQAPNAERLRDNKKLNGAQQKRELAAGTITGYVTEPIMVDFIVKAKYAKQAMANSIDGGADRGGGLEACNATLFSLCNSRLQRKEKRPSKKFSLYLAQPKEVLEIGQTPGKVCAHEFPTCIFLLNELTHLTFSGYSIRHIPLTIGSLLPYLKVR